MSTPTAEQLQGWCEFRCGFPGCGQHTINKPLSCHHTRRDWDEMRRRQLLAELEAIDARLARHCEACQGVPEGECSACGLRGGGE